MSTQDDAVDTVIAKVIGFADDIQAAAEETKLLINTYRADKALDDAEVKTDELIQKAKAAKQLLIEHQIARATPQTPEAT